MKDYLIKFDSAVSAMRSEEVSPWLNQGRSSEVMDEVTLNGMPVEGFFVLIFPPRPDDVLDQLAYAVRTRDGGASTWARRVGDQMQPALIHIDPDIV